LNDEEKDEFLSKIPQSGYDFSLRSAAEVLRVEKGHYAFSVGIRGGVKGHIPKDLLDLVLRGNDLEREYSLSGLRASGTYGVDVGVTRGFSFDFLGKPLCSFVKIKGFYGLSYFDLVSTSGTLLTDYSGLETSFEVLKRESRGGWALDFDLGLKVEFNNSISASFVARDVGSGIYWSKNSNIESIIVSAEGLELSSLLKEDSDSLIEYVEDTKNECFRTDIPTSLNLGLTWNWGESRYLFFSSGYCPYETPMSHRGAWAGLGIETKIYRSFAGRAGIKLGGEGKYSIGVGCTLPIWKFFVDVGFENVGGLLWSSRGGRMGLGFSTRER
jgi:hypothetical protein